MELKRILHVSVIFTNGKRAEFSVDSSMKVQDFLDLIKKDQSIDDKPNSTISILYHGKIVDTGQILGDLDSMDEFSVHCFFRTIKNTNKSQELDDLDLKGFDRLQRMNYTTEQIATIRQNFRSLQGINQQNEDEMLEIEDEWFPALFSEELPLDPFLDDMEEIEIEHTQTRNGRSASLWNMFQICFLCGFLLGYLLGAGALLFMFLTVRNKKLLFGIFIGTCFHYMSTVVRGWI